MKTLLVGINSKFTHICLSIRSLSANSGNTEFVECTINENFVDVLSVLYNKHPEVVCFSCYIWNIEYVLKLASTLKKMLPDLKIILGGPEVSFSSEKILEENDFVDAIIRGEGEETFRELTENGFKFKNVLGVTYKENGIISNPDRTPLADLDSLAFAYARDDLLVNRGKLIYYESSRGCPYNCSYCLSSTEHGVRFKSLEKTKQELLYIINAKPKTIKFVDRTFNADKKRTTELIKFMIEKGKGVTFHFEIEAHTLNDELINVLKGAPEGMFRFEIGLQSTNAETLRAINRSDKTEILFENIKKIIALKSIHVHLDLIAGLPHETYALTQKSINNALDLKPDVLQLGFLKMLKGTKIRSQRDEYRYIFNDFPPYEVLGNAFLSCAELLELKKVEMLIDKFYNSGAFGNAIEYMKNYYGQYWSFFYELKDFFDKNNYFNIMHSRDGLYKIFVSFASYVGVDKVFYDLLKLDYIENTPNCSTPEWSLDQYSILVHKQRSEIVEKYIDSVFAEFRAMPLRVILKSVHFEVFSYRIMDDCSNNKFLAAFTKQGKYLGEIILNEI